MHLLTRLPLAAAVILVVSFPGTPVDAQAHPEPYLVKDLAPGTDGLGPDAGNGLLAMGDLVLGASTEYLGTEDTPPNDWTFAVRLIRSDGTAPGTFQLLPEDLSLFGFYPATDELTFLTVSDGHFGFNRISPPTALWRTDGTKAGTYPLTEFGAVTTSGARDILPTGLYVAERNLLFFVARDPAAEEVDSELWVSDGTPEGTRLLEDLHSEESTFPRAFVELDGIVYFIARGAGEGTTWGRSDGTPEGTFLLPNPGDGDSYPLEIVVGPDELSLFLWNPESDALSLWRSDGTEDGARLLADLGAVEQGDFDLAGVGGGRLYFDLPEYSNFDGSEVDRILWSSDGTPEGTAPVPVPPDTIPVDPFDRGDVDVIGGRAYFLLNDGVHGTEPWVTDGTAGGTRMIREMCPGPDRHELHGFQELPGLVLFQSWCGVGPDDPWVWDPETDELRHLADLCPGECGATVVVYSRVGDSVYFRTGRSEVDGPELWVTDGTPAGTVRLSDFQDEPHPFVQELVPALAEGATDAAVAGGRLFFGARDVEHGWELWAVRIPGTSEGDPPPPPGDPLTSPELPGYAVWVRIVPNNGSPIDGRAEPDCIPETLCVSGALEGRSELFVRIVGPKPNGFLWPTLVKFSTSTVEVWIEQLSTGVRRYYRLEGASPGSSELPGLFDRDGFRPTGSP